MGSLHPLENSEHFAHILDTSGHTWRYCYHFDIISLFPKASKLAVWWRHQQSLPPCSGTLIFLFQQPVLGTVMVSLLYSVSANFFMKNRKPIHINFCLMLSNITDRQKGKAVLLSRHILPRTVSTMNWTDSRGPFMKMVMAPNRFGMLSNQLQQQTEHIRMASGQWPSYPSFKTLPTLSGWCYPSICENG